MSIELNGLAQWIYTRMTNPNALNLSAQQQNAVNSIVSIVGVHPDLGIIQVYERMAPKGAVLPYVVYQYTTGMNLLGSGGYRIAVKPKYQIKGITGGESYGTNAQQLADAIDALFNRSQDMVDPVVTGCSAIRPIQYEDFDGGERHNHYGEEVEFMAYDQSSS